MQNSAALNRAAPLITQMDYFKKLNNDPIIGKGFLLSFRALYIPKAVKAT